MKKFAMTALIIALVGSTVLFAEDKAAVKAAPAATTTTTVAPATTAVVAPATTATTTTAAATVAADVTATGVVVSFKAPSKAKKTPAILVINVDGKDLSLDLSAATKVIGSDGKPAKFVALKAKAKVTAVYTVKGTVNEAVSVTLIK